MRNKDLFLQMADYIENPKNQWDPGTWNHCTGAVALKLDPRVSFFPAVGFPYYGPTLSTLFKSPVFWFKLRWFSLTADIRGFIAEVLGISRKEAGFLTTWFPSLYPKYFARREIATGLRLMAADAKIEEICRAVEHNLNNRENYLTSQTKYAK